MLITLLSEIKRKLAYAPFVLLALLIAWWPAQGRADNQSMLEGIRQVAADFALSQVDGQGLRDIKAVASRLDPRLRLSACEIPLEAFTTNNSANLLRTTVGVRCNGVKPWTLYVPVSINAIAKVVFTARPVTRGEALDAGNLELREVSLQDLPFNHLRDIERLQNMEMTRPLKAGVPLTLNAIKPRHLVRQGQEVVIWASNQAIQVRMAGTALKNGAKGDLIPVRNNNSGRTITAEVLNNTTVKVRM